MAPRTPLSERSGAGADAVTWRPYAPSDREACLEVFDTNVPRFFFPRERDEFEAFLAELPGPYFVLLGRGNRVVGCGGIARRDGGEVVDLCWGMVRQELHGRGLGRRLTILRLDRAKELPGVRAIKLHTSQHTVGFYETLGFRIGAVQKDGYGPGLDRCEMRLNLPSARRHARSREGSA